MGATNTAENLHVSDRLLAQLERVIGLESFYEASQRLAKLVRAVDHSHQTKRRLHRIVRELRAVVAIDGDVLIDLDGYDLLRELAERLDIPYLLLLFIKNEAFTNPFLAPADVDQWNRWAHRDIAL